MRIVPRALPVVALVLLSLALLRSPSLAVPQYAARTGLACGTCHFDPNGGGPRNEFGHAYASHRHSVTPDTTGEWKDLSLTNRVSDTFPLYFGFNQRFMTLTNQHVDLNHVERLGFYNMESSVHIVFQPHRRLAMVYSIDAFGENFNAPERNQEAYGLISGFPLDGYVRVGRFRAPYGLRMDDHTVATRNSYGDLSSIGRFLPYDPRFDDMGVEVGADKGIWFGRAAYTDGASDIFAANPYAEAKMGKFGMHLPWYEGAFSIYDDLQKTGRQETARFTRWGYYGMTHHGPLSLLGEFGAGTDAARATRFIPASTTNLIAWFSELDYTPVRSTNFRVRVDHLNTGRSHDPVIDDLNSSYRYAIEGEYVPVPFCELRWVYRYIKVESPDVPDERQAYLQVHLSY